MASAEAAAAAAAAAAALSPSSSSSLEADSAPGPEAAGAAAAAAVAVAVAAAARMGPGARVSKAALATKLLSLSGVFAVHKPKGPTSAELLNRLKEKLLAGTAARVGAERKAGAIVQGSRDERKGSVAAAVDLDPHLGRLGIWGVL